MIEKISVVIPMYNNSSTIRDALESIRLQSRIDAILQIMVVNDGSKDDSLAVVSEYSSMHPELPITIINQQNKGASAARNAGLKAATGDWIALLDADDEWFANKIERQLEVISENPQIDFLGADADEVGLRILWRHINKLYKANIYDLTLKSFPVTPSVLMKKKIFDEIGGFDENQSYAEDGKYYMKICLRYNYYHLPERLVSIGHGKRSFGESGLSANLAGMYDGNVANIKDLYDQHVINKAYYAFLRVFFYLKYVRRIVITKLSRDRGANK